MCTSRIAASSSTTGTSVGVGGTDVAVGWTGVSVGTGLGVTVAGTDVAVGAAVGSAVAPGSATSPPLPPHPVTTSATTTNQRNGCTLRRTLIGDFLSTCFERRGRQMRPRRVTDAPVSSDRVASTRLPAQTEPPEIPAPAAPCDSTSASPPRTITSEHSTFARSSVQPEFRMLASAFCPRSHQLGTLRQTKQVSDRETLPCLAKMSDRLAYPRCP